MRPRFFRLLALADQAPDGDGVTGNLIGRSTTTPLLSTLLLKVMADISAIAKQFTDFYYQTFDSNRANLKPLYVRSLEALSFFLTQTIH